MEPAEDKVVVSNDKQLLESEEEGLEVCEEQQEEQQEEQHSAGEMNIHWIYIIFI